MLILLHSLECGNMGNKVCGLILLAVGSIIFFHPNTTGDEVDGLIFMLVGVVMVIL